jgi:sortase A
MSRSGTTTAPRTPGDERVSYGSAPTPGDGRGPDRRTGATAPGADPGAEEAEEKAGWVIRIPHVTLPKSEMAAAAVFGVGLLIVLFLVYLFAFTPLSASRNQQRLAQTVDGKPLGVYKLVAGARPPEGQPVAVLSIPAIGFSQIVVQGTSAADLMNGPGLMPGTALPGAAGNSVIAGRRTTFGAPFGSIGTLQAGYRIHVVDGAGTFNYLVTGTRVVTAGQHDVVAPTADNRITLVTSNGGLAPNGRLVVQAKLVGKPVDIPGAVVTIPRGELGLGGDGAAGVLAALWSLATIVLLIGAAFAVWRWRRPVLIYVFAAPVVVAFGLLACESLARALPATF